MVSVDKNIDDPLEDVRFVQETTDIVESINALERKVRKVLGNITGLVTILFIFRSAAHGGSNNAIVKG